MTMLIIGCIIIVAAIIGGAILVNTKKTEFIEDEKGFRVRTSDGSYAIKELKPYKVHGRIVLIVGVIFGIILGCISMITSIKTGHTGVVTTFGRVENYTLDAGVHFKAPWNKIIEMDNRVQKATIDLECFSSDIQEVTCRYTLNYQISKANAQDIYRTVGKDYFDTVITPNVSESVKTIMAHYTAENLIGSRDALAAEIEVLLSEQLQKYNIEIVSTSIEDMDFTDEFTNAVEAKQVAVQNKLKAQTEQEQKTMEAQQAAERAKIDANAQAEVAKIQAEADLEVQKINADAAEYVGKKEASRNKAINESLTGDLLKYYLIQQWDGKYPDTYMGSENVSTLLNISSDKPEANKTAETVKEAE